ncbi:MAG: FAD-dependent oxidoreductase [Candidatus Stahlbacteria bacterium]|nr:FAD-dependent oxidoreductase [Candidatus Stahlbacteria bacterium]
MINLTINGQKVEVAEKTTILKSAQQLGIKIPALCSHKALPPYGACRLCLVELHQGGITSKGRQSYIQASCTYPAQEGLIVQTDTDRVKRTRKIMAELLLARCPDADEVKHIAHELGVEKTRIKPKNEDCLLCGLCVRMCRERMGKEAIGFSYRGSKRKVVPAFDIQSSICQTCGACYFVCPTKHIKMEQITKNKPLPILSEFDRGLRDRSAIYIPFPQAVPNYATIDKEHCVHLQTGECKICQEFCESEAIDFDQKEELLNLNVGAIVTAPGYDLFDPSIKHSLGYKKYPNVLTSAEFERILSPSGPYQGHILRPSDGKEPKKIAFIQCVGSRDNSPEVDAPYCSGVCCMHSIKEAIIAKEHIKDIESTIFYMDMRAQGKDFDKYYERAQKEYGVKFIRSRIDKISAKNPNVKRSDVIIKIQSPKLKNQIHCHESTKTQNYTKSPNEKDGNLIVYYTTEDGKLAFQEFNMVILAIGFRPIKEVIDISDKLKIRLNKYNYLKTFDFYPMQTTRDGIFACGVVSNPKDIPETVMQASGAAGLAAELLSEVRGTEVVEKVYPPERDIIGEKPRIGVFVCHCGINIGGIVNVPEVIEYAKTLPNVVYTEHNLFTCSQDTQQKIKQMIKKYSLNRVVVASCSPRTHEPLFQETLREGELNPQLFEMANIRDQCSWVHLNEPPRATKKAKDLVRMAVAKSTLLEPLPRIELPVIQKALVIGGGLTGMVAALSIADQGYEVTLVEKEDNLGGNLRNLYYTIQGQEVQKYLASLIDKIEKHPKIKCYKGVEIENIDGYIGNYKTTINTENGNLKTEIEHGIVIVATGAEEEKPKEYLYGNDERVITQLELEKLLTLNSKVSSLKSKVLTLKNSIVMIQCVGSREEGHPYCSRVCCQQSIKNAIKIKELNPKANIYILYRDMRTYGFWEEYYQKARDEGIIFIRYEKDGKPRIEKTTNTKGLIVKVNDPILGVNLVIEAGLLVLASAIVPRKNAAHISKMLKVPLNEDKFFLEAHVKLRPVDFATEGIFMAGLAHSPKTIDESISQAKAAAARACRIISKNTYEAEAVISTVNEDLCSGCGICESVCAYKAPEITLKENKRISQVNKALCKGCGACASACPSGAMQQMGFKTKQLKAMLKVAIT